MMNTNTLKLLPCLLSALLLVLGCNRFKKENITPDNATYVRVINMELPDNQLEPNRRSNIIFNYNGMIDGVSLDSNSFVNQFSSPNVGTLSGALGGNTGATYKPNGLLYIASLQGNFFSLDESSDHGVNNTSFNVSFSKNNIDLVYELPATSGIYRYQTRDPLDSIYNQTGAINTKGYFPNADNRIAVGPIMNGISFHKWAALASGLVNIRINQAKLVDLANADQVYTGTKVLGGPQLLQEQHTLQPGQVTTLVYGRSQGQPTLMTLQEPTSTPFKPGFAYIRFVNVTNLNGQSPALLEAARSLDVYVAPIPQQGGPSAQEQLVSSNLRPFVSPENLPYVPIDFTAVSSLAPTDSLPTQMPEYEARIYPSGQNEASGATPTAILRLNTFINNPYLPKGYYLPFNPLVAWTPGFVQPLIRTFFLRLYGNATFTCGNCPIIYKPAIVNGRSLPAEVEAMSYDLEPANATNYYYH